jgi:hypothetical protein
MCVRSRFAGLEQETAEWSHCFLHAPGRWLLVWPSCCDAGVAKLVWGWLIAAVVVLVGGCSQVRSNIIWLCSSRFVALLLMMFLRSPPVLFGLL